jgi:hypothetical protein
MRWLHNLTAQHVLISISDGFLIGKASSPEHSWPDLIDHQKPEFITCCFVMYFRCFQTGF